MNLSFGASNDGKIKIDKDGNKIITLLINDIDLQTLAYFHLRSDTTLVIRGRLDLGRLECGGFVQDITIKDSITVQFVVESNIDLNLMYQLCRAPEPWTVRISDAQEQLSSFEQQYQEEKAKKAAQQTLAGNIVDTFGVDGAKQRVEAAKEIVSGKGGEKVYNVSVEKFM